MISKSVPNNKLKLLKDYFEKREEVIMAFIFGSRVKGQNHYGSDWDIGVYFKPKEYMELETEEEYPDEDKILGDLYNILESNEIDFLVMNRAKPSLVYNILRTGTPLKITDKKLYFDLLCKTSYEAMDWWGFVREYREISEKANSLTKEARSQIDEKLSFLEEQFQDINKIKKIDWLRYSQNRDERRNIERWVENLVMTSLDIAKVVLASDKKAIPQGYKEILKIFTALYIDESLADKFAEFANLRNIVVHEYLDMKWKKIENFVKQAEELFPKFIEKVKTIIK